MTPTSRARCRLKLSDRRSAEPASLGLKVRLVSRIVFTIWWISGILSLLALLFPALIVIGLFLLVLPGLMLAFAPDIVIIMTVLMLANLLFGRPRGRPRLIAYALFLGAFVVLDFAVPWSLNRSLDQYWQDLPSDDVVRGTKIRGIALLFARRRPEQGLPITSGCHYLCKQLLVDHAVQAVLIGLPPATVSLVPLDLQLPVTSYQIEYGVACVAGQAADPSAGAGKIVEQMSDGVCLAARPATLAASDLVIVRDGMDRGPYPNSAPWRFYADRLPAERLGVYQISAGQARMLMLRIRLRAEPFFMPLIIGLANGYGMESVGLALLRWPRSVIGDNSPQDALIDDFFRRHFKLDISFLH
jgi:hypothetical protein